MINIDGKVYRNLVEQVKKNKEDIAAHYAIDRVLADFGIRVIGQVDDASELPDAATYAGDFGDAYAVGTSAPYHFYVWTRANDVNPSNFWFDIGELAIVGPQGIQGIQGVQGVQGVRGNRWTAYPEAIPTSDNLDGDCYLGGTGRVVYYDGGAWLPGPSLVGPEGPTGPAGPKGDTGDALSRPDAIFFDFLKTAMVTKGWVIARVSYSTPVIQSGWKINGVIESQFNGYNSFIFLPGSHSGAPVKQIGESNYETQSGLFYDQSFTGAYFNEGIERIENYCFEDSIQGPIYLPSTIQYIGTSALVSSSRNQIYYNGTLAQFSQVTQGDNAFGSGATIHCSDGDITIG